MWWPLNAVVRRVKDRFVVVVVVVNLEIVGEYCGECVCMDVSERVGRVAEPARHKAPQSWMTLHRDLLPNWNYPQLTTIIKTPQYRDSRSQIPDS